MCSGNNYFRRNIRLYPNKQMQKELDKLMDYDRYCWNKLLEYRKVDGLLGKEALEKFRKLRSIEGWHYEIPNYILSSVNKKLVEAITETSKINSRIKKNHINMPYQYLNFKTKKSKKHQSFIVPNDRYLDGSFKKKGKNYTFGIVLGRGSKVKSKYRMMQIAELPPGINTGDTEIASATILKICDAYYVSFCLKVIKSKHYDLAENIVVGIDPGIKSIMTLSTGRKFKIPKKLKKLYKRQKYYRSRVKKRFKKDSRIQSKRCLKTIAKYNKTSRQIFNLKEDWLHKITTKISRKFRLIKLEDCDPKDICIQYSYMKPKMKLVAWKHLETYIEYKVARCGGKFIRVSKYKASTQTCNHCGYRLDTDKKMRLSDRIFVCPMCGYIEDRDINAAKNIAKFN